MINKNNLIRRFKYIDSESVVFIQYEDINEIELNAFEYLTLFSLNLLSVIVFLPSLLVLLGLILIYLIEIINNNFSISLNGFLSFIYVVILLLTGYFLNKFKMYLENKIFYKYYPEIYIIKFDKQRKKCFFIGSFKNPVKLTENFLKNIKSPILDEVNFNEIKLIEKYHKLFALEDDELDGITLNIVINTNNKKLSGEFNILEGIGENYKKNIVSRWNEETKRRSKLIKSILDNN